MYIKELAICDYMGNISRVDFLNKLNIIYGPSNTGKSVIIECIDYLFGGKQKVEDTMKQFEYVSMILSKDDKDILIKRVIGKNEVIVKSEYEKIETGVYKIRKNPNKPDQKTLNDVLLILMNIKPRTKIIVSKEHKKQDLTFRTFLHCFLIKQEDIIKRKSILLPNEKMGEPAFKSALIYLMTGTDFVDFENKETTKVKKIKRGAVIDYVNENLEKIEKELAEMKIASSSNIDEIINDKIENYKKVNIKIDEEINKSKELSYRIYNIDEQLVENENMLISFNSLMSQYNADLNRVHFILDGINALEKINDLVETTFSKKVNINNEELFLEGLFKEQNKILFNSKQLEKVINEITEEVDKLQKEKSKIIFIKKRIKENIDSNLSITASTLKEDISEYSKYKILNKIVNQYKNELIILNQKLDIQDKFEISDYYDDNILEKLKLKMIKILRACQYDNFQSVDFMLSEYDFYIDGKSKFSHGQGYRAYLNTLTILALYEYLVENRKYCPGFIIIDSPEQSLVEEERIDKSKKIGLFNYLLNNQSDKQIIIIDNNIPESLDYKDANIIEFTKDCTTGRYGFIENIR